MRECRFRDEPYGCGRSLCRYPHGETLCDPEPAVLPKTAGGKVSVLVDSFDYYCVTTLCWVVIFADHRNDDKCPACKQSGEMIGGAEPRDLG